MAKSANQKLKILYIMDMLLTKSDIDHPLSIADMIDTLEKYDIRAERKSIYDDLAALRSFGFDINQIKAKNTGYYIGQRKFELAELKILIDNIQASKFITAKKSHELIAKISSLTSAHKTELLKRQVYIEGRIKTMNSDIYEMVDQITIAINKNRQIRFKYFKYSLVARKAKLTPRKNGIYYQVSPIALVWHNGNYYAIAYDEEAEMIKHYRVDKMAGIEEVSMLRRGHVNLPAAEIPTYANKIFDMFSGDVERVEMRFDLELLGVVVERFGREVTIFSRDDGCFTAYVSVAVSEKFYGWVFGFGTKVQILSPPAVVGGMKAYLTRVLDQYV